MLTLLAAQPSSYRSRAHALGCALALGATLAIAGCAPGGASSGASSARPTATPAPRILYQADWTNRASEWTLPPHWSIADGKLINDGQGFNSIQIPYQVTAQSYTVTIQMAVTSINSGGYNNQYLLVGQSPAGVSLYSAGVTTLDKQNHGYSDFYPAQPAPEAPNYGNGTADFTPGLSVRPYTLQVDGPYLTFSLGSSIGGGDLGTIKSAIPLAPARLSLLDQTVGLEITGLTITMP